MGTGGHGGLRFSLTNQEISYRNNATTQRGSQLLQYVKKPHNGAVGLLTKEHHRSIGSQYGIIDCTILLSFNYGGNHFPVLLSMIN